MSRNRESWLLSLALPHIPFLLLVKSFPFTFPPGLYFGGEKTPSPCFCRVLETSSGLRQCRTALPPEAAGHPARRSRAARTDRPQQSLALPLLTFQAAQSL